MLEPLEARRLLAGLQVSVFLDHDVSRDFNEQSDTPAENRLVFVDLNQNGQIETNEPLRFTDAEGLAYFDGLADGDYSIGILANPNSQRLTTSTGVAPTATLKSSTGAAFVFQSATSQNGDDAANAWAISEDGFASRLNSTEAAPIFLGGRVLDGLLQDDASSPAFAWLLIDADQPHEDDESRQSDSSPTLVQLDLTSGRTTTFPIVGLAADAAAIEIAATSDAMLLLTESPAGRELLELRLDPRQAMPIANLGQDVLTVAGVTGQSDFATSELVGESTTLVSLRSSDQEYGESNSIELDGVIESLVFSSDASLLFATRSGGGVYVLKNQDGGLALQAILADADGPLAVVSGNERLVTRGTNAPASVIVWDTGTWQPIGTSRLPAGTSTSVDQIAIDRFGELATLSTSEGVFSLEIAESRPIRVKAQSGEPAVVNIGLRLTGANSAPQVNDLLAREISEDTPDQLDFDELEAVSDSDGDQLWYTVLAGPSDGSLSRNADGSWNFTPDQHFFGVTSATLQVHDGLAATEFTLQWDVASVNDPPTAIHLQLPILPEDVQSGSQIGFVSVADPDADAEYRITTSDSRFTVSGGQIFFTGDSLDFESEPSVEFQVFATDVSGSEHSIETVARLNLDNVNEVPTALRLSNSEVEENVAGAEFGNLRVDDPDIGSVYRFEVSDDRFEVVDGILRLTEGTSLDFESTSEIVLTVTAEELGDGGHEISEEIRLSVLNKNEAPTDILLSQADIFGDTNGAVVGAISVNDPDGDQFFFDVSDPRFIVADGVLRLHDDFSIDASTEGIALTISAFSRTGDQISKTVPIVVLPPPPPYQNPLNPADVNGDGIVTPLDALELINDLNQNRGGILPPRGGSGSAGGEQSDIRPDVNGDGSLTPLDVLIIINELNKNNQFAEGESPAPNLTPAYNIAFPVESSFHGESNFFEELEKQRKNAEIDRQLETLIGNLDELRFRNA